MRKETLHLFDNAFDIIAGGLRLDPALITSDRKDDEPLLPAKIPPPIDIDEQYTQKVKGLYSEIVDFISRAQAGKTPEQIEELFALRTAGQDIVEVIKAVAHMQKNLNRYVAAPYPAIRRAYYLIRHRLAEVLLTLVQVREQADNSAILLSLDALKLDITESYQRLNSAVDRLIQKHQITAEMATSLINDANYAYGAATKLIEMGILLFSTADSSTRSAERSFTLEEDEISEVLAE